MNILELVSVNCKGYLSPETKWLPTSTSRAFLSSMPRS
jgi:hypothetical protein